MDDEPEVIRHQMQATRSSLTDKIERLEQTVTEKVQDTTAAVNDTVESVKDAVQDTVNTVKGSVHDTVDSVRSTVTNTVESVKDTFDVPRYFRQYPWAAFAAAIGTGFAGGAMLGGGRSHGRMPRLRSRGRPFFAAAPPPSDNGNRGERPVASGPSSAGPKAATGWTGDVAGKFGSELGKLKGVALGAVFGLVRDWIARSAPGQVGERLGEVIDDVTRKFGGEPFRQNLLNTITGNSGKVRERDAASEARSADRATAER